MSTFAQISEIEQALSSWITAQNNPAKYKVVATPDEDKMHLPKQGVNYMEYMNTLEPHIRKAFLTDLSYREPASFIKTAHALYGTTKSLEKEEARDSKRTDEYDNRISTIRRIRNGIKHYRRNSNRGLFYVKLIDKTRNITIDSSRWEKRDGRFNSAGKARMWVKKAAKLDDSVRIASSWDESGVTPIMVFAILPKMSDYSNHFSHYEAIEGSAESKPVNLTWTEVENAILNGEWDDEDKVGCFQGWGEEDLSYYRHDGRNADKDYRKFHDLYEARYHGSMELDSEGEETFVLEQFYIERDDDTLMMSSNFGGCSDDINLGF